MCAIKLQIGSKTKHRDQVREMDPVGDNVMSKEKAKEVLEANIQVCNHVYTFIYSMSLKCAVQLGIPEAILGHGKAITVDELASALPSLHPSKARFLPQLLQLLAQAGYFTEHKQGHGCCVSSYTLTPASEILLAHHPCTIRPYLLAMLDPHLLRPWGFLSDWFRNDHPTPFSLANGMSFYEYTSKDPSFSRGFNESMASDSRLSAELLVRNPDWAGRFDGLGSLVDVGGGTGIMARAIAEVYPHIKCSVLDLPHVISGLQGTPNLSFVSGDVFEAIPPADAVLLKRMLIGWDDENAVKIMKQCRKAVANGGTGSRGKVILIDIVLDYTQKSDSKARESQYLWDMQMMVLLGGKVRNESEWKKLFEDSGFTGGYDIHPDFGLWSLIEVYP